MAAQMKTIYKYTLSELHQYQIVLMPKGAEILCAKEQGNNIFIWAIVDTSNENEARNFRIYGTGNEVSNEHIRYIGTAKINGGNLIFHIFEAFYDKP